MWRATTAEPSSDMSDVTTLSRDELEAEVIMLRSELAQAKLQLALMAGDNDEYRHELSQLRRRFNIIPGTGIAASIAVASGASVWTRRISSLTFWKSDTTQSDAQTTIVTRPMAVLDPPAPSISPAATLSEARRALAVHKTFSSFTAEQLEAVVDALVEVLCRPGDVIIRQGDTEDTRFFIVSSGKYSVLVHATGSAPVHTYRTVGDSFGELALRYSSPRKATVICDAGGVLWALTRDHFQLIECTWKRTLDATMPQ